MADSNTDPQEIKKKEDTVQTRLSEEERQTIESLKKRFHLKTDSAVIHVLLGSVKGRPTGELRQFLFPDVEDESLRLLAA